jgi:hypothetical protein
MHCENAIDFKMHLLQFGSPEKKTQKNIFFFCRIMVRPKKKVKLRTLECHELRVTMASPFFDVLVSAQSTPAASG